MKAVRDVHLWLALHEGSLHYGRPWWFHERYLTSLRDLRQQQGNEETITYSSKLQAHSPPYRSSHSQGSTDVWSFLCDAPHTAPAAAQSSTASSSRASALRFDTDSATREHRWSVLWSCGPNVKPFYCLCAPLTPLDHIITDRNSYIRYKLATHIACTACSHLSIHTLGCHALPVSQSEDLSALGCLYAAATQRKLLHHVRRWTLCCARGF